MWGSDQPSLSAVCCAMSAGLLLCALWHSWKESFSVVPHDCTHPVCVCFCMCRMTVFRKVLRWIHVWGAKELLLSDTGAGLKNAHPSSCAVVRPPDPTSQCCRARYQSAV